MSLCDLQLPFCKTCLNGGRICEGYSRYPVFVNRTRQGIAKREPFEEAKPSQDTVSWSASYKVPFAVPTFAQQKNTPSNQETVSSGMSLQPSNAAVCEAQLISTFWEHYIPQQSIQTGYQCAWLQQTLGLPDPSPALRLALKALAMARLGWIHRDNTLVLNGRVFYGQALQEVQKSLYDERTMWQDETLATGNILALYEFCEPTNDSIAGWNSHTNGVTRLMMIQAIQNRKASPLGSHEWCARISVQRQKKQHPKRDLTQRLYDHGFALAALFEETDKANLLSPEANLSLLTKYLRRCSALDATFNLWYQDLTRQSSTPLYWLTPPNDDIHHTVAALANRRPFSYPDLRVATTITAFWGCKLALSNTIAIICTSVLSMNASVRREDDPRSFAALQQTARRLLIQHGDTGRLENATNIIRSMPYCLHDSMGVLGPQKSLFPLRAALLSLRKSPGEELNWCLKTYQELVERKGLGYAREVGKVNAKDRAEAGKAMDAIRLAPGHGE
ncbi:MAG: hypothetical protein ASARMPRED_009410 [Alectoria sarmentosa]|nr:MAG: hypothetical protein ASARMPRED_009410 [Alectoria sarmentosa]